MLWGRELLFTRAQYTTGPYYLAKITSELLPNAIYPVIMVSIIYW